MSITSSYNVYLTSGKNDEELPGEYELIRRLVLLDEYDVETISGTVLRYFFGQD